MGLLNISTYIDYNLQWLLLFGSFSFGIIIEYVRYKLTSKIKGE